MFFQDDRWWMFYGLVMAGVIGMAIGAVTGSIVSFVLRLGIRYVAATRIAWPGSATNHNVVMTIVTVALAATLPILRELYRFRKKVAIKSEP